MFITLVPAHCYREKMQYSRLSHYVSVLMIAGIKVLRISLNLIKYSSHLNENIKMCFILPITLVHSDTLTLLPKYDFSS